jgi:poly(3-hydroxybutyrate) depolymerase
MHSQQINKSLKASNGVNIGFLEYKPGNYAESSENHPLIIFLHGIGECGNGTTDLNKVRRVAIPKYIDDGHKMSFYVNGKWETFIVLSPQIPQSEGIWPTYYVKEMIKYAEENLRIDKERIFLTGLSLGGGGTWKYVSESLENAEKLAAIATVCAPQELRNPCNVAKANLPMWSFHAENDHLVSALVAKTAVRNVNNCSPGVPAIQTIWKDGGHTIWDRAYDLGHRYQSPNVFEWFLGMRKQNDDDDEDDDDDDSKTEIPDNGARPPVANAGVDQTFPAAWNYAPLINGTLSKDPDGWIQRVAWTKISGPDCWIVNPAAGSTRVQGMDAGTYVFRVTVTDNEGLTASDDVKITVTSNGAPTVDAGPDIVSNGSTVWVNGNASADGDGYIMHYVWQKMDGPRSAEIVSPHSASTALTDLQPGTYRFRLKVRDNDGRWAEDELQIRINGFDLAGESIAAVVDGQVAEKAASSSATLTAYPNPAQDQILVQYGSQEKGRGSINIYDQQGIRKMSIAITKPAYDFQQNINLSTLTKGTYVLELRIGETVRVTRKLIKR